MVLTGGGDCPGLNAVIRAIVKRASQESDWEILGCVKAFDGILNEPTELMVLDAEKVAGIHYQGGTIIQTTNKGGPFAWPVKNKKGEKTFFKTYMITYQSNADLWFRKFLIVCAKTA